MLIRTALGLACVLLLAGCGETEEAQAPDSGRPPKPVAGTKKGEVRVLGRIPPFALTDQAGKRFAGVFPSGHVWVVNFIFTRCAGTCPAQTTQLTGLQNRLDGLAGGEVVRFLSITVDPEFDSPGVLYGYAQAAQARDDVWTFLTGDREAIWDLAKKGFRLPVGEQPGTEEMPIFHSSKMVLVDSLGRIRGYHEGTTDEGIAELTAAMEKVLAEPRHFVSNPGVIDAPWLAERAVEQRAALAESDVLHDFSFTDRLAESGITFVHRSTPDGAQDFRFSHYDHGNGVPVADVDGDGRFDLFFPSQAHGNELWRNLGGGKFENVSARAGIALADRVGVTGAFADVDNDGDPDLYVTTVMGGNVLFLNDGTGRFEDVTARSGLGHVGHSSTPVFFDYDRDGLLDVLLTNVGVYTTDADVAPLETGVEGLTATYRRGVKDAFAGHIKPERSERNLIFRNLGDARFEDVSDALGFVDVSWAGDASPVDFDRDGWIDVYLLDMQGNDQYWVNEGGKRFVKKGREIFPKTPWGAMGVKSFDWDNDGDLDLYVTDMHSDMAEDIGPEREKEKMAAMGKTPESLLRTKGMSVFGNAFYRNDGDGTFTEVSDAINAENYWPWGLSVADVNADGYQDAFLTSCMNFHFRYGANSLLLNDAGRRFLDAEFVLGVEPRKDGKLAKPWFTLDAGGKDRDHAMSQRFKQTGVFTVWDALGSRASAIFDLDDDGDLDIVTNDFNSAPMILISDLAERHPDLRYLKVALQGTKSNRDGLGARVTVHAGGKQYVQVHDGQSGYLSQSVFPLYFGLAGAKTVDRIDVLWPSGAEQTLEGPHETNRLLKIVEP